MSAISENSKSNLQQIKARIAKFAELEKSLSITGPSKGDGIIRQQSEIEEYYYADVCELLETMEIAIYQLEQLEPLLEMPERGYVRNNFNAVIRTLKEGF